MTLKVIAGNIGGDLKVASLHLPKAAGAKRTISSNFACYTRYVSHGFSQQACQEPCGVRHAKLLVVENVHQD